MCYVDLRENIVHGSLALKPFAGFHPPLLSGVSPTYDVQLLSAKHI